MPALPPKADMVSTIMMSALCQKQTHAPQQLTVITSAAPSRCSCHMPLRTDAAFFASSNGMSTQDGGYDSNWWRSFLLPAGGAPSSRLATPDWFGKLIQLESVGGRAPESRCIHFAWRGGGVAYRNGGADAFSRRAFDQRHWHLKVL
jgi:hypothetical protein